LYDIRSLPVHPAKFIAQFFYKSKRFFNILKPESVSYALIQIDKVFLEKNICFFVAKITKRQYFTRQ